MSQFRSLKSVDDREQGRVAMGLDEAVKQPSDQASYIKCDVLVTGEIDAVDLQIDGTVKGDVRCVTLVLGAKGSITGTVEAQRVRVFGTVLGTVNTGDLAIESTGRIAGETSYARLRMASGGVLTGRLAHRSLESLHEAGAPSDHVPALPAASG